MTIEAKQDEELKTLKDLKEDSNLGCYGGIPSCEYGCIDIIRQEAIKWVKEFRKNLYSNRKFGKTTATGLIYGFIQFFNLTEEDLK